MIHAADLAGSCKKFEVAKKWAVLVSNEFMNQSQDELRLGLPVSPHLLNLDITLNFYKSELSFMRFIIQPFYSGLEDSCKDSSNDKFTNKLQIELRDCFGVMNTNIQANIQNYEKLISLL